MNISRFLRIILAALLLCFSGILSPAWSQEKVNHLLFRNGQAVDVSQSYSVDELATGITVNSTDDLVISAIYLVREARPVKAIKFENQKDLKNFDLYSWSVGNNDKETTELPNDFRPVLQSGDRFAFDATWKGKPMLFTLKVK